MLSHGNLHYKVPKTIECVTALPRTASGKLQRFRLAGGRAAHGK